MVANNAPFKEGQLVTFAPSAKDLQTFPYQTCGYEGAGVFILYEKIDTSSYPSWNDFNGYKAYVCEGETGILIKKIGIPAGIQLFCLDRPDLDLNVYTVLLNGREVQVFGADLV